MMKRKETALTPSRASTSGEGVTLALDRLITWISRSVADGCMYRYGLRDRGQLHSMRDGSGATRQQKRDIPAQDAVQLLPLVRL